MMPPRLVLTQNMTHGAGAVSSGGGGSGGFSGGSAFYSVSASSSSSHNRRRTSSSASSNTGACWCYLILFLFCLTKMEARTRIWLTWVWVVGLAVAIGTTIGMHYFSTQTLTASPTDMRKLDKISPTFCEGVTVNSTESVEQYIYHSPPKIKQDSSLLYEKQFYSTIDYDNFEYWGFYLLENSIVTIDVCPSGFIDFYIIKGETNLETWKNNPDCSSCYDKYYTMSLCSLGPQRKIFTASDSDQYYFLFENQYVRTSDIRVKFSLRRKVYDVKNADFSCYRGHCTTPLDIGTQESIVIYVPEKSPFDITVNVTCNPRIWFVVIVFVILPFVVGLVISCAIHKKHRRRDSGSSRRGSQIFIVSNTDEELHGVVNDSYPGPPPSYAELPPSYEEATRGSAT